MGGGAGANDKALRQNYRNIVLWIICHTGAKQHTNSSTAVGCMPGGLPI